MHLLFLYKVLKYVQIVNAKNDISHTLSTTRTLADLPAFCSCSETARWLCSPVVSVLSLADGK